MPDPQARSDNGAQEERPPVDSRAEFLLAALGLVALIDAGGSKAG